MSIIRADSIKNRAGNSAPTATNGFIVTGVCTATSFSGNGAGLVGVASTDNINSSTNAVLSGIVTAGTLNVSGNATVTGNLGVGGVLTYEDVTNVDSLGVGTFRDGLRVTGICTATSFVGDGSGKTRKPRRLKSVVQRIRKDWLRHHQPGRKRRIQKGTWKTFGK